MSMESEMAKPIFAPAQVSGGAAKAGATKPDTSGLDGGKVDGPLAESERPGWSGDELTTFPELGIGSVDRLVGNSASADRATLAPGPLALAQAGSVAIAMATISNGTSL